MRGVSGSGGGLLVLLLPLPLLLLWSSSHMHTLCRYAATRGGVPGHMKAIPRAMRRA